MEETKVSKKYSLKTNFLFNLLNQILTLALPLITAPYIARVLHEEGVGQISYVSSIIAYFTLFANLGFDMYGQRQIARYQDDIEKKSKVFWEIFIIRTVLTVIALVVLISILFSVGFGEKYNTLMLIQSLTVIGIPLDIQYLFRGDENFVTLAIKSILIKIAMIALIFIFVKSQADVWIYALCSVGVTVVSNIFLWPSLIKRIKRVPLKELSFIQHFRPSLIIFLPTLAVTIFSVFDKTMIGLLAQNPDYENGCYEQAYKINSIALILVTVVSSVMTSRNAHDYEVGEIDKIKDHLYFIGSYIWMVGLPLIAGFAVLSSNLSSWFLGEGYDEVPLLMQIMSVRFVVSGFGDMFGTQLFIAIQKEKYPTISAFAAAIINVGLNIALIPSYGALGAAIATAVSECVAMAMVVTFARKNKFFSIRKMLALSWKYVIASLIMFTAIFFTQRYMNYSIGSFCLITAMGIVIYALSLFLLRDKFFITNVKNVMAIIKSKLISKKHTKQTATDSAENTNEADVENINQSEVENEQDEQHVGK